MAALFAWAAAFRSSFCRALHVGKDTSKSSRMSSQRPSYGGVGPSRRRPLRMTSTFGAGHPYLL
jgi:hypothetical protein